MTSADSPPMVSFATDIAPIFAQYAAPMRWRMDLTSYEDVKANAAMIYERISATDDTRMPPPMFDALDAQVIQDFRWWMDHDFPE